jgi:hypothetical protein
MGSFFSLTFSVGFPFSHRANVSSGRKDVPVGLSTMTGPLTKVFSSSAVLKTLVDDDGLTTLMGVKANAGEKTTDAAATATENFIVNLLFYGLIIFDFSVFLCIKNVSLYGCQMLLETSMVLIWV